MSTLAHDGGRARGMLAALRSRNVATSLRLASGLTMFTFVVTHLSNHALGLVSLDVMLQGQQWFFAVWHSLPGSLLLAVALTTHLTLVLYKQVVRRTLRMPVVEGVRILLGMVTLFCLSFHATTMVVQRLVHLDPVYYPDFLTQLTVQKPILWNQLTLVIAAWTHGSIGVHLWLRLRAWYRVRIPLFTALAVLLPALALLGVLDGAREAHKRQAAFAQGGFAAGQSSGDSYGSSYGSAYGTSESAYGSGDPYGTPPSGSSWLAPLDALAARWGAAPQSVYGGAVATALLLFAFLARIGVQIWERRQGRVTVRYPGGRTFWGPKGASVLDISRMGGIPHASVCGGRGRCSTCRVHVDAGWETLLPPEDAEQRVLNRIKAPARVRLACQLCPVNEIAVTPLVPANARARDSMPDDRLLFGTEQEIVILFADLRGFTKMSEHKLPYDVVHILNQYFAEMGEAIETAGGYLDKFIGDGIMALFGIRDGVESGARNALAAARGMGQRLGDLNGRLALDLAQPLKLGIGIHVGHVIVGEMGYRRATSLTAIGDSVNVASRLESETKEAGCQLLVSEEVGRRGGIDLSAFPLRDIQVRGRVEALRVHVVGEAEHLPALDLPPQMPGGGVVAGAARPD